MTTPSETAGPAQSPSVGEGIERTAQRGRPQLDDGPAAASYFALVRLQPGRYHRMVEDPTTVREMFEIQQRIRDGGTDKPVAVNVIYQGGLERLLVYGGEVVESEELLVLLGTECAENSSVQMLMFKRQPFKELIGSVMLVMENQTGGDGRGRP